MPASHKSQGGIWLFDLAAILTIISALIYATGWTYAYHYFSQFHLGLLQLEIPAEYYFMYGFWVFKDHWLWLLSLSLATLLAIRFTASLRRQWRHADALSFKSLQGLAVILLFLFAGWLAQRSAVHYYQIQQSKRFDTYPHIQLWLRSPSPQSASLEAMSAAFSQGEFRLLLQTDKTLFVFKPPPVGDPAQITVTQLSVGEVQILRLAP